MNIEIINPIKYPNWNELLLTNDQNTFFHTSAWAKVLTESYQYKPLYFTVIDNDKISALIPIMEINSYLTGKRGVSLPFTDECSPIGIESERQDTIIKAIIQHGKDAGWKYFELRGGNDYLSGESHATSFYTHNLDPTRGEDKIFSAFRNSNKRNIKRAQKEGVHVSIHHTHDSLMSFYQLNCLTRKTHGLPPQPFYFFEKIYEHVISFKKGIVALARFQDKIIAGAVYFLFNGSAIYKYGASDRNYQQLRPNNLVMWRAIKWCIDNGFKHLSFGRTEPENEGLLQFKRGWGAREEILNYYKYDLKQNCFVAEASRLKSSYNFFKFLPTPLSRLTGNILYRHVG